MAERRAKMKYRSLERGGSAPHFLFADSKSNMSDSSDRGAQQGHDFHKKTYYKPTYCQHCTDMLWGIKGQGFQCSVCNYVSHERCIPFLMTSCAHVIANSLKDPVPHQWAGPRVSKKKKKWCNVCRLRINGKEYFCRVCRIYSHQHCKSDAFNNCKDCASYSTIGDESTKHHWIEGNLPSSSRCEQCGKNCFTDITLSGFRCGWCGITVHSSCRDVFELVLKNQNCNFRALWHMMLPPNAVSCPISIAEEQDEPDSPDTVPDDENLSPVHDEEDGPGKEVEGKGRPTLIIDGSAGKSGYDRWRKRRLQPTYVPKEMTADELLIISLRKCSVTDNFDEYYLASTASADGSQNILCPSDQPYLVNPGQPGLLKLYIKKKVEASSKLTLRIHNSRLSSSHKTVSVKIEQTTTTADIIKMSLAQFEIEEEDHTQYCLYEVSQDIGVSERLMDEKERPWCDLKQLTEDSIRSANLQRYYLHPKEQIITTLYLWNLPAQSLQTTDGATTYVKTIVANDDLIDNSVSIGPLFPTHGALFIEFKNSEQARNVRSAVISNGHNSVKILPNIHESQIRKDQEPLLVFINARSGGNQGKELIYSFQRHLNPHQVYDLAKGGPLPGLYVFQKIPSFRVLVGGGDGTVGWVLGGLDSMRDMLTFSSPPCATVPLGTGNDLARALKWGGGYTGEKVMQILFAVEDANVVNFDRWDVAIKEAIPGSPPSSPGSCKTVTMNNYLGIGLDAEIALDFHNAREEHPEKFNSRFHNKSVYFQLGVQKTFSRDNSYGLAKQITLLVDDKKLEIPRDMKGIVFLNIQSWGAGSEPWGSSQETGFVKNAYDDELLEVMGISGPVHIGQIKSGMKNGIRLAQGRKFTVDFHEVLPVQIDGEAWQQTPCCITVKRLPYQTTMLEKSSKRFYQSRGQTTQHDVKDMLLRASVTAIDLSQLSSRRQYTPDGESVNSPVSGISHTLYRKLDEEEFIDNEADVNCDIEVKVEGEKKTDL